MPWNGSGTYAPPAASFPEVTGTTIDAARFNATVNDLASGITAALAKNGENAATANLPMGGFKHTGAAVAANANEYVTWNQTGVKFPALGIGTSSAWVWAGSNVYALDIGPRGALVSNTAGVDLLSNSYFDGTNYRAKATAGGAVVDVEDASIVFYTMASVSAGAVQTLVEKLRITTAGLIPTLSTSAPVLSSNLQMAFALTSDTNLRISVRGSDGTTRVANITLA